MKSKNKIIRLKAKVKYLQDALNDRAEHREMVNEFAKRLHTHIDNGQSISMDAENTGLIDVTSICDAFTTHEDLGSRRYTIYIGNKK